MKDLGWLVARDVNRTVGGGMAAMELMRRSFEARGWIDGRMHGVLVAVSRLTPGTNVLAYCVAAGWTLGRLRGSLVALAAASLPASIVIYLLSVTVARLDRYPVIRVALALGMLAASLLVFASAWNLLKPFVARTRWPAAAAIAALALALYAYGWTPVRVLLVCAVVGYAIGPRE